jgi:hypothetical protein
MSDNEKNESLNEQNELFTTKEGFSYSPFPFIQEKNYIWFYVVLAFLLIALSGYYVISRELISVPAFLKNMICSSSTVPVPVSKGMSSVSSVSPISGPNNLLR